MRAAAAVLVALVLAGGIAAQARAADEGTTKAAASVVASSGSCSTVRAYRGFKLLIGIWAWKYYAQIQWCWNGRKITSFGYRRWAEVYVPTWDFCCHIGKSGYGGVGTTYARRWTQGKFKQCATFCVQTKTPWVSITVTRKGNWSYETGG